MQCNILLLSISLTNEQSIQVLKMLDNVKNVLAVAICGAHKQFRETERHY